MTHARTLGCSLSFLLALCGVVSYAANAPISLTIPIPSDRGVAAEISVTIGGVSIETFSEQGDRNTSKDLQGDLQGIARTVVHSHLYQKDPTIPVIERGLTIGGAVAPLPQKRWLYNVYVDSFSEFRMPDGRKCTGVDATLSVSDSNGRTIYSEEFHDPPKNQRVTAEQIQREIRKKITGAQMDQAVAGMFADMLGGKDSLFGQLVDQAGRESAQKKAEEAEEMLKNLQNDGFAANLQDYQFQEVAVRQAVETLIRKAPMPGQLPPQVVPVQLRTERKYKNAYERGFVQFKNGNYSEAITAYESIPQDSPEKMYNLGAAYLGKACELISKSPSEAIEFSKKADECFVLSKIDATKEASLLTAPATVRKNLAAIGIETERTTINASSEVKEILPLNTPSSKRFALLIGISKFVDKRVPELPAAVRDVDLMKATLCQLGFSEGNIIVLKNEQATCKGIREAIENLARQLDQESLVVISIATHGTPPQKEFDSCGEGYIFCHDSLLDNLFASAYPFTDFRTHIAHRLWCKRKIIFQDTCHSAAGQQIGNPVVGMRFMEYPAYFALFTACRENESSVEVKGNGLFTKAIADFLMENKSCSMNVLKEYLYKEVPQRAAALSVSQTPEVFLGPGANSLTLQ